MQKAYSQNGARRVILVTHSYGGIMTHRFLVNHVTAAWKRKYVECWVPVAVPWAGSVASLHGYVSGKLSSDLKVNKTVYANMIRSWESTMNTLPVKGVVRGVPGEGVIASVGGREYTALDVEQLVARVAGRTAARRYLRANRLAAGDDEHPLRHPGVDVRMVISSGVDTVNRVNFPNGTEDFLNTPASLIYGDGDGSVNAGSLGAANHWGRDSSDYEFKVYEAPGTDHQDVLKSAAMLQAISDINKNNGLN